MRAFITSLFLVCVASAQDNGEANTDPTMIMPLEGIMLDYQFQSYASQFSKIYETVSEYEKRRQHFMEIDHVIRKHNSDQTQTFIMGHNHLSDMTYAERQSLLGLIKDKEVKSVMEKRELSDILQNGATVKVAQNEVNSSIHTTTITFNDAPEETELDWRSLGAVSPIQDQGLCGACWTFMTNAVLEGAAQIADGGDVKNLSEQQILDCASADDGNSGCTGGYMWTGYQYLLSAYSISDSDYPYTAGKTKASSGTCYAAKYTATDVKTKSWSFIKWQSGEQIRRALSRGPVGVAINGGTSEFQQYKTGLFSCSTCGNAQTDLDHAVTLVGYGIYSDGSDYFILKNQWATVWGDSGYMYIKNDGSGYGESGINWMPTIAFVDKSESGASSMLTYGTLFTAALVTLLSF